MLRVLLTVLVLGLLTLVLPEAAGENPVTERHLIGAWMNGEGSLLLEMRADRQAIFTIPSFRPGEKAEPQFGDYSLSDGVWTLKVTDINRRDAFYSIVSLDLNKLNLRGANNAQMIFHRIGTRFSDLDRNHDGVLEYHEIKDTRLGRHFNDIDANKDTQLTAAEFVAYWIRFPPPVVIQK